MAKNKKRRMQRQRKQRSQTKKSTPTSTHSPWRLIGISILIAVGLIVFVSVFGEGGYDSAHLAQIKPKPPIIWTANAWQVLADSWGYRASKFMRLQMPVGNIAGILVILGFAVLIANKLSQRLHRATATVAVIMVASGAYMSVGANCAGGSGASANITPTPQPGVVYFLDDHLGNTHLVTDSVGNVVYEESRYPYGVKRHEQNTADSSEAVEDSKPYYSYTGKEYDEETGLVYFGGRYYAPELGRWITPDPLFLEKKPNKLIKTPKELNSYAYVQNNPITYRDEDGLKTTITIERDATTDTSISGTMTVKSDIVSDTYSGYTIEPKKGGADKSKDPVAVGKYDAIIREDHTPNRVELKDVPNYSNIQIHIGNDPANDSIGCFLVGSDREKDKVTGSRKAMKEVLNVIEKDASGEIEVQVEESMAVK
jgi:RHS repeat-associated protein